MSFRGRGESEVDKAERAAGSAILVSDDVHTGIQEPRRSPGALLWRDGNFNLFWAGQTFDALGDSFSMIVMPLLVLEATGSIAQMGLVTATLGAGNLIAGLFSGIIVDRVKRRNVMIGCDLGRAFIYALIPLGWWLSGPATWLIYVVAAVTGYLNMTFMITYTTFIPNIVDQNQLLSANGRLQATVALSYVTGPMLAGVASHNLGPRLSLGIITLTYLSSAFFMALVRARKFSDSIAGAPGLTELLAGLRFLMGHPVLRSVNLLLATFFFFVAGVVDISVFRLKHDLNQSDDSVGIVFGIASLGAIMAGGLVSTIRARLGFGLSYLGGQIVQGLAIAALALAPSVAMFAAFSMVFTFGNTVMRVTTMSLRQQITPDHLLGRVTAVFLLINAVPAAAGAAIAAVLTQKAGSWFALILMGGMCIAVATIGTLTPAFSKRPEEAAASAV